MTTWDGLPLIQKYGKTTWDAGHRFQQCGTTTRDGLPCLIEAAIFDLGCDRATSKANTFLRHFVWGPVSAFAVCRRPVLSSPWVPVAGAPASVQCV
eukprot:3296369-Amphidinium_carterae.2